MQLSCDRCESEKEQKISYVTDSFVVVLHILLVLMRGTASVSRFYMGTSPVVVVADPTLVDAVLTADHHTFTTEQQVRP